MSLNFDNFNSVVELFEKQASTCPDRPYLWRKMESGYEALTWKNVRNSVVSFATALKNIGILDKDSKNSWFWSEIMGNAKKIR